MICINKLFDVCHSFCWVLFKTLHNINVAMGRIEEDLDTHKILQ